MRRQRPRGSRTETLPLILLRLFVLADRKEQQPQDTSKLPHRYTHTHTRILSLHIRASDIRLCKRLQQRPLVPRARARNICPAGARVALYLSSIVVVVVVSPVWLCSCFLRGLCARAHRPSALCAPPGAASTQSAHDPTLPLSLSPVSA